MNQPGSLPRILVIDDLFGRRHPDRPNSERASLCGQYLLRDVTADENVFTERARVRSPIAEAVFCRGQKPASATVGDVVENDLEGTLDVVRAGWFPEVDGRETSPWAMVLLDLCFYTGEVTEQSSATMLGMPEGRSNDDDPDQYFGLTLLSEINARFPDLPVVILSSQSREEVSREFAARGALAFISRADANGHSVLAEHIRRYGLVADDSGQIVGWSKPILLCLRDARRAAASRRNVLIRGERGTGKELLAHYIHRHSPPGPFVVVDSGSLSPQLYASELFGHKKGAYTGADKDREGKVASADGGGLFLDEIGNMPLEVQVGLLRVIEHREVAPLGAQQGRRVDVRFICATNENLEEAIECGEFRADLLDRLTEGGIIHLPPLRERKQDIPLLAEQIVRAAEASTSGAVKRTLEAGALDYLERYDWPGNIRELRNALTSAVLCYPDVEHLFPAHIALLQQKRLSAAPPSDSAMLSSRDVDLSDLLRRIKEFPMEKVSVTTIVGALDQVQSATARLQAALLKAALQATRRPVPENPDGAILIHPALKLLTGDKSITASRAADLVKRIVNASERVKPDLLADPVLRQAFEIANRLRPGSKPSK